MVTDADVREADFQTLSPVAPETQSLWADSLRSVLAALGFFLLGSLSDLWLQRHATRLSVALADDGLVGICAGLLVFLCVVERKLSKDTKLRYAAIVESTDDAIIGTDVHGTVRDWNKGAEKIFGYVASEAIGKTISFLRPTDRFDEGQGNLKNVLSGRAVTPYETVGRRKDGTLVEVSLRISPIVDADGRIVGTSGIARDVTERKRAEAALSAMTRKLVEAQEQERARIARELHDDINQRLALLAVELEQLKNERNDLPSEVRVSVQKFGEQATEIAADVQTLSHELHSSKLDYLGVVRAMASWCRDFGERQGLEIDFKSHDVPKLPREISLCLFRVLQEAVHNVAKHCGKKRIEVQLSNTSDEIHLIITDSGEGFDIEAARQSRGLGLTSMQERVRLIGGTIVIVSKPGAGTTIHVRVPFGTERCTCEA